MTTTTSPRNVVLLDLDGTLTKSDPGILGSVVKAYETIGIPVPDDAELRRFIGPAIIQSFRRNHIPDDLLPKAVDAYRAYYSTIPAFDDPQHPGDKVPGQFCNGLYAGIPEQLASLKDAGYLLVVATAKPEYQAMPVCEHFGIDAMVDGVYGASKDGSRIDKDQVIRYVCRSIAFNASRGDRALMVGDRWTDVDGAKACGFDCLGCRWGYAEAGELESHGAVRIIDHVDELSNAVAAYFSR